MTYSKLPNLLIKSFMLTTIRTVEANVIMYSDLI